MLPVLADHSTDALAHGSQVDRHVRGVGDEVPVRIENGAGEVESFLDVHRVGGLLKGRAHLLGNRHEEVIEDLEHHRVGFGAHHFASRKRDHARQHEVVTLGKPRLPAGLDDGGAPRFGDDGRAVDGVATDESFSLVDGCVLPIAPRVHGDVGTRLDRSFADHGREKRLLGGVGPANHLDRDRLHNETLVFHREPKALTVSGLEPGDDGS